MISARFPWARSLRLAAVPIFVAGSAGASSVALAQTAMPPMAASAMLGPVDGKDLPPTDLERIAIGTSAPDFTLAKYGGGTTTLSSFKAKKNVVLVFYRGYWCPYCVAQLKELRTLLSDELKKETEMLVVSIDDDKGTATALTRITADGMKADFTFLSDPEHEVIARYGVLNPAGTRRGIPHPATFVIDKKGVVQWRDIQTDYKIRPTNAVVLAAVKALPVR